MIVRAISFAETGTLPYLARKYGAAEVAITMRATRLPTGVFPASRAEHAYAVIQRVYPAVEPCGDALSGALMNAGPVIHPPLIMMNAAPLQHFPEWDIHNEGTQPAVRSVTDQLDNERFAVREALGYLAPHFPLADHYNNDQWIYGDGTGVPGIGGQMGRDRGAGGQRLAGDGRRDRRRRPATGPAHAGRPRTRAARRSTDAATAAAWLRMSAAPVLQGIMGRGIALAYAGHAVALIDIKPRAADQTAHLERESLGEIGLSLSMLAGLGMLDAAQIPAILARVRFVSLADAGATLTQADVVFDGVPEVLEGKRDALSIICHHIRTDTIVASTTFLVTELAAFVKHPERLLNAHWINPAYIVPLVELSAHPGTSAAAVNQMKTLLERAGKVQVVCAAPPDFIVPRLQALVMNDAAHMVEQGLATATEIDKATRYGFGFASIGVVEFIDFGDNDTLYYASRYLAQAIYPARFAPPAIIEQYMKEGPIGLKAGKGFYDYGKIDANVYRRDVLGRSLGMLRYLKLLCASGAVLHEPGDAS